MKKKVLATLLAGLMALSLAACGGSSAPAEAPAESPAEEAAAEEEAAEETEAAVETEEAAAAADASGQTYYMISYLSTLEFWDDCYAGFQAAADLYGAKTEYTGAEGVDPSAQITVLEQVIATQPDGIAITCCDATALEETINKAIDAGIEVVCFDADSPGSKRYSCLQTGNDSAGAALADIAAKELGETGQVGVIFSAGSPTHEARAEGIKNQIESNYPNMSVVEANFDGEQEDGASAAASLIQANPDLKAIFVVNANGSLGAAAAVREAGKTGEILVVGFDTDGGMYEAIANDEIFATARQGCYNMGFWSMQFLYMIKNGIVNPTEGWRDNNLSPVPPHVDTGVDIVTKDNLSVFYQG